MRSWPSSKLISVALSVTTLDAELARTLEPRTATPAARLRAIRELSAAGVPVRAMLAPIIPGLTDSEIPAILAAVKEAGARGAGFVMLRLPLCRRADLHGLAAGASAARRRARRVADSRNARRQALQVRVRQPDARQRAYAEGIAKTFEVFCTSSASISRGRSSTCRSFVRRELRAGRCDCSK